MEGLKYINVGELIKDKKLYKNWNEEFDVPEFDTDMVVDEMEPLVKNGGVVVDFHSCDFFPERFILIFNP